MTSIMFLPLVFFLDCSKCHPNCFLLGNMGVHTQSCEVMNCSYEHDPIGSLCGRNLEFMSLLKVPEHLILDWDLIEVIRHNEANSKYI